MKVILLEDVDKLGKKYEVKEVKEGYARNFLFPKKLAKAASKKSLEWLESRREELESKAEEELSQTQAKVEAIDGLEVIVPVKVGDDSQLFEGVSTQKISDKLKELGFEIKKNQIDIKEPIKELGEFPTKINFKHNLEAEIKVIITAEEK